MKYISLLIVIILIAVTFWFSRKTEDLSMDQMNRMNKMITDYMTQVLEEKHPDAAEIEFSKIYNEVIESGRKMKAHFKFSYKEPGEQGALEKVYRKGSFLVTSEDGKKWTAQIEKADDVKVEFMEPFEVTTNGVPVGETRDRDEKKDDSKSGFGDKESRTEDDENEVEKKESDATQPEQDHGGT